MIAFYEKISQILKDIVKNDFGVTLEPPIWELPTRQEFGDFSSMAAMRLASQLKKNPLEIAASIKAALAKQLKDEVCNIDILKPGFVNIFLSRHNLINSLNQILENKENYFRRNLKRKILLEFCSANPTGTLSIAHGRQAIVGDTIANILKFYGNDVLKEYYLNDEGNQIDLLIKSVVERIKEIKGEEFTIPEGGYIGEYIKKVAQAAIEANATDLRSFVLQYMVDLIKKDLAAAGIYFDNWASQKRIMEDKKVEAAVEFLKSKGLIFENEGALWFASTKFGDDKDRVIKKADGELTYFASDIAYHKDKIERGFEQLINLWGPDHHGYINRVKSAIEAIGYSKDILTIIIMQLVTLKTKEKMSKRKGTAILLSDLVDDVGKDAARFFYLTRKNSSILEFDIDLAKEASINNPLYYIQYSCARIESIFEKAGISGYNLECSQFLKEEAELNLLRLVLQFFYCLEKAYYSLEPVFIIEYLKNLAAGLHKFYETTKVITDDKKLTTARLNLLFATRLVLRCGLNILGITPAKKM